MKLSHLRPKNWQDVQFYASIVSIIIILIVYSMTNDYLWGSKLAEVVFKNILYVSMFTFLVIAFWHISRVRKLHNKFILFMKDMWIVIVIGFLGTLYSLNRELSVIEFILMMFLVNSITIAGYAIKDRQVLFAALTNFRNRKKIKRDRERFVHLWLLYDIHSDLCEKIATHGLVGDDREEFINSLHKVWYALIMRGDVTAAKKVSNKIEKSENSDVYIVKEAVGFYKSEIEDGERGSEP